MASPVALTDTESANSVLGGTLCVTRGWAELAGRTNASTADDEPGWRLASTAVDVTVILPRTGALIGTRAVVVNVTSRGPSL